MTKDEENLFIALLWGAIKRKISLTNKEALVVAKEALNIIKATKIGEKK